MRIKGRPVGRPRFFADYLKFDAPLPAVGSLSFTAVCGR